MACHDKDVALSKNPYTYGGLMTWRDWLFVAVIAIGMVEFGVLIWAVFFAHRKSPPK